LAISSRDRIFGLYIKSEKYTFTLYLKYIRSEIQRIYDFDVIGTCDHKWTEPIPS